MKVSQYDPAQAIPDLSGKVVLVTGGTSGIGYQSVLQLAQHNPAHIVFTGRNQSAADKLIGLTALGDDRISFLPCDMMSLASVKACMDKFLARFDRLDIFLANAGIAEQGGSPERTSDGYEKLFAVNYMAHALMDTMLLPLMDKTAASGSGADVRVVIVSSDMHQYPPKGGIDYDSVRDGSKYSSFVGSARRYAQSKLGNVLRADGIAARHPAITTVSLHPGVITTEMNQNLPWYIKGIMHVFLPVIPSNQGAFNQLWAATAPKSEVVSGTYYEPVGAKGKRGSAVTPEACEKLWQWTEAELQKWL